MGKRCECMSWLEEIKTEYDLINIRESAPNEWELTVSKELHVHLLNSLKSLSGGGFNHLSDLTGYDEFPQTPRFHVVYHLSSMERKERCSVVVPLNDEKPEVKSVVELWAGADWLEREVYDMYGIHFIDHPDERRILLPPTFKGHPLRKDFVVDYRQEFNDSGVDESFDPFGNTIVEKSKVIRDEVEI